MSDIISIKQENLLPFHIRILGFFLLFFGILGIGVSIFILAKYGQSDWLLWLSPLFALLGALIFFSHYRLVINVSARNYTVLTWTPFFKKGQPQSFRYVARIYINPVKETTTYTTRAAMRYDSTKQLFKAFMKLDDGEKVHLDTDSDEQQLQERVDDYINRLGSLYQPE